MPGATIRPNKPNQFKKLYNQKLIFRFTAEMSNPSSPAIKTEGYPFPLNNDRNFSDPIGVLQHGFKMPGFFYHVKIVYLTAFFGICFTSCPGMGSNVFSKNKDVFRHFPFLPVCKRHAELGYYFILYNFMYL